MAHRTALITAGSIAIVVAAAAVAIGANFGILSVADSRPVGKLSASAAVQTGASPMASVPTGSRKVAVTQKYIIKKAGTVSVAASKGGLRLVDVASRSGWKWALAQTTDKRLTITFRSHARTYKFVAVLGRHRTIVARVDEPVTKVVPSRSTAVVAWSAAPATASAAPAVTHGGESDHGDDGGGGAGADD